MKRIILIILVVLVLAAVAALYFTGNLPQLAELINPQQQKSLGDDPQCSYVWATQPLPEVTVELQKKLIKFEIRASEVEAAAYGENCVLADGSIDRFITMQTDLYFKVPVADFEDQDSLGRIAEETILFVEDIPNNTLPGPQEGYIQVNFISAAGEMQSLWFRLADGRSAINDGLKGAALFEYLMDL